MRGTDLHGGIKAGNVNDIVSECGLVKLCKMSGKILKVSFEDALNMTGFSRYNICMFMLCSSIIMGMAFELFSVSYLVPASVCELHTTNSQQGIIACVPLAGIILTSPVWGYLADTRGRKKIIIISMTMGFVAGSLSAFSPNWIALCILKFASSASVAGAFALSVTLLSECTPLAKRSTMVILSTSVFLTVTGCMAVIAIPILPLRFSYYIPGLGIQFNSWRVLGLIYAMPSAVSAFAASFAYESPKFLLTVGKDAEALEVLRGIYVMNTGNSGDSYQVGTLVLNEDSVSAAPKGFFRSLVAQLAPMVKAPLLKYTLLLSALFLISYICINSFMVWLPFIANVLMTSMLEGNSDVTACEMIRLYQNSTVVEEIHDCSMNTFAMTTVFGIHIILAITNIIISRLIGCVGRKRIFITIQFMSGIASLCVNSSPYLILTAVLFLIFISGVFNFGFLSTYSVDIFPTYVRATAVCLTLMVGRGSAVVGINVLKQLLDYNCECIFYIFGAVSCLGGFIGFLLPTDAQLLEQKKSLKA